MLNIKGLILFCSLIFFSSFLSKAQEKSYVKVEQDTLITLLQKYRSVNEINPSIPRLISLGNSKPIDRNKSNRVRRKGFRVQIYAGTDRSEAYAIQSRFQNQYANMDAYITYSEPNYRVKVGDFKYRSQANEFMNIIRSQYKSVFVFQEDIWVWE